MFTDLETIKNLRKTQKLRAEQDLERLDKDFDILMSLAKIPPIGYTFEENEKGLSDAEFQNRSEGIHKKMKNISDYIGIAYSKELQPKENFKRKINQLEKYLEELTNTK